MKITNLLMTIMMVLSLIRMIKNTLGLHCIALLLLGIEIIT